MIDYQPIEEDAKIAKRAIFDLVTFSEWALGVCETWKTGNTKINTSLSAPSRFNDARPKSELADTYLENTNLFSPKYDDSFFIPIENIQSSITVNVS